MGYFAVNEHDCVFRIETGQKCASYYSCINFGDSDTLIEIMEEDGTILNIECIYLGKLNSEPFFQFPDIRSNPELDKCYFLFAPDGEDGVRYSCFLNVTQQEFDIVFSGNTNAVRAYYKDGRVEYYYNDKAELLYIKVIDLTEEEFEFLYRWVK